MFKSSLDRAKLTITCPSCRHSFKEAFSRLKHDPEITCPNCGQTIQIEGGAAVDQMDRSISGGLAGLRRSIQKANKGLK